MATVYGLVMDIAGLYLRTSFVGADRNAKVSETHDRVLGAVIDEDDNVIISNVGLHVPIGFLPRHNGRGQKIEVALSVLVAGLKDKKFHIRSTTKGGALSTGGTLELWYGDNGDVAAEANYKNGKITDPEALAKLSRGTTSPYNYD